MTEEYLLTMKNRPDKAVTIRAGNWRTIRALHTWFHGGGIKFASAAASDIVQVLERLVPILQGPLTIRAIPLNFFAKVNPEGTRDRDAIFTKARRLFTVLFPLGLKKWGPAISRIAWNRAETKAHLKHRYCEDGARFFKLLGSHETVSCRIFEQIRLSRDVIKKVLRSLYHYRVRQVAFSNIVCATRYKSLDEAGQLTSTLCPLCRKSVDSLEHMLHCAGLAALPEEEALIDYLHGLTSVVCRGNPGLHMPFITPTGWDTELSEDTTTPERTISLTFQANSSAGEVI